MATKNRGVDDVGQITNKMGARSAEKSAVQIAKLLELLHDLKMGFRATNIKEPNIVLSVSRWIMISEDSSTRVPNVHAVAAVEDKAVEGNVPEGNVPAESVPHAVRTEYANRVPAHPNRLGHGSASGIPG